MDVRVVWSFSFGLILAGCGSEDQTLRNELLGSWITSEDSVAVSYTFTRDGTYEYNLAYLLNPQLEIFVIAGSFDLRGSATSPSDDNGNYLFLQPHAATCPVQTSPVAFIVALSGDSLVLIGETDATTYERVGDVDDADSNGGGAAPRYGCFTREGFFPYPLEEF